MVKATKAAKKPRAVDGRRVVIYDLTDEEKAWVTAQAAADDRSVSVWLARLVREKMKAAPQ